MKKLVGIFVVTLLILSAILPLVNSRDIKDKIHVDNEDCKCGDSNLIRGGFFGYKGVSILPDKEILSDEIKSILIIEDLPDYFNWMDYEGEDWTSPAKSQTYPNPCGSCWDFAAIGALESVINIREGISDLDPDLSEQYVLSCLSKAGNCNGGSDTRVFRYIIANDSFGNNCNGIIPESCFPYQGDDTIPCEAKSENWQDYLIPVLDYGATHGNTPVEEIKSNIMQYGPISSSMMATNDFNMWGYTHHSPEDYYPYEESIIYNHIVVVLGWKDDASIDHGGYWICKNSWGENFGYNGFFNIEYECNLIVFETAWVDYDPESYDWHPIPKIHGSYYDNYYGLVDEPIQFSGDASGEHPPFMYYWDFGDDSTSEEQNPTHTYTAAGEYMVTLTVTDDNDNSFFDTSKVLIQVTNQPPDTPIIECPNQINKDEYFWCNITYSDPDNSDLETYNEPFGLETGWVGPYHPDWQMDNIQWNFSEEGDYTYRVKARDPYGAESDWAEIVITVSKSKTLNDFNPWLLRLIHRFPILEFLLY